MGAFRTYPKVWHLNRTLESWLNVENLERNKSVSRWLWISAMRDFSLFPHYLRTHAEGFLVVVYPVHNLYKCLCDREIIACIYRNYIEPALDISVVPLTVQKFCTIQGYKPPDEPPSEYQSIPLNKIEDFGVHCKQ